MNSVHIQKVMIIIQSSRNCFKFQNQLLNLFTCSDQRNSKQITLANICNCICQLTLTFLLVSWIFFCSCFLICFLLRFFSVPRFSSTEWTKVTNEQRKRTKNTINWTSESENRCDKLFSSINDHLKRERRREKYFMWLTNQLLNCIRFSFFSSML